ncbi:hypothetical protein F2P56_014607 [Juglans regia]|uniref:Reverse transcriptase domain-containing protein n=2 Tax=Juglans regia TaxID=51240 RepID=A0A833XDE9_JUGRE|nr:uncharacterized protein LOC108979172 [Juglans regia]KAF5464536.1 hypothetical protein F2P56_014607 [Juglans regia]
MDDVVVDLGSAETKVQIQDENPAIQEGYVSTDGIHCDHLCKEKVCASDCDSPVKKKDGKRALGSKFSWCNGKNGMARSWSRIDHGLWNLEVVSMLPDAFYMLFLRTLDHAPLLVSLNSNNFRYGPSSFKFQQMWVSHDGFLYVVKESWQESVGEESDLFLTKEELDLWQQREYTRLSQQVKLNWLEKGEASSQFFKTFASLSKPMVKEMKMADGTVLATPETIHEGVVDYSQSFLSTRPPRDLHDHSLYVQSVVVEQENRAIIQLPSIQEIKELMFAIPLNSSLRSNGFGSGFYQSYWDIVEANVVEAIRDLFLGTPIPRFYSASYIVLIPKVSQPSGFENLCPISFCYVIYKVFSKILVKRMSSILEKIIFPEQGAFFPGRNIFENIALAQEMICNLVRQCISSSWFSIVMNGTAKGFFLSDRRLRQGDPLLPYLFILVEQMLCQLLKYNFQSGKIGSFSHPQGAPLISHLLYADDIIVFANGGRSSIKRISDIFNIYEEWSGQRVSKEKSAIFFSKNMSLSRRRSLLQLTSFSEGCFPAKYLEVPLISGCMKITYVDELLD